MLMLLIGFYGYAQKDSLATIQLDSVVVKAARLPTTKNSMPASISVKQFESVQANLQQLSVNEYLQGIPGLFLQNSTNFAQDSRISIRGFGSRAAFGIRGIKLVVDGIPETTPDGQGQVDNLNLGLIESIEVLRGASSSLYGNASGGVVNIQTTADFPKDFVEFSSGFGSYNFQNYQILAGLKNSKATTTLFANRTSSDGYRDHSQFETYQLNIRSKMNTGKKTKLNLQLNYTDSPTAQDSGGVNEESVALDRSQARDRNVEFDTGEAVRQLKTGMALKWRPSSLSINSFAYYSYRDFANRLPFEFGGAVDLVRNYWGHGSSLSFHPLAQESLLNVQLGYEMAHQNDKRTRFMNNRGTRGNITLNQNEIFNNFGSFVIVQSKLNAWNLRGGLRFDHNVLKVEDAFLDNGDATDKIVLNTVNPSIGFRYKLRPNHSLFANFATSFETPVLSELSADPLNNGGFNKDLQQQTATTYELGYSFSRPRLLVETTLFYIETQADIVPFELEEFPERTFFRNAGSTERLGLEFSSTLQISPKLTLDASYAWSHFDYTDYEIPSGNFNENRLPGIPEHLVSLQGMYRSSKGLSFRLDAQYRGSFYANDANTVMEDAAFLVHLSASQSFNLKGFKLKPYLGINNLFNTKYSDNIRINAFGNRYFEPAPEINAFGGIRLSLQ